MRCPACQALNPDTADWCTQCYAALAVAEPQPEAQWEEAPEVSGLGAGVQGGSPPDAPTALAQPDLAPGEEQVVTRGRVTFRRTAEGLDWRCGVCERWNPVEVTACTACRTPFARTVAPEDETGPPRVSENVAVVATAVVPGLGHILLGRTATGLARALMYLLCLVGGMLLAFEALDSGQTVMPAVPLLAGALVLWVGSVFDAVLAARGSTQEILRPRVFLWFVVAVIALLLLSGMAMIGRVAPA